MSAIFFPATRSVARAPSSACSRISWSRMPGLRAAIAAVLAAMALVLLVSPVAATAVTGPHLGAEHESAPVQCDAQFDLARGSTAADSVSEGCEVPSASWAALRAPVLSVSGRSPVVAQLPMGRGLHLRHSSDLVAPNPARHLCSFSGETEVLMADGTTKPISEIEVGDWVLAEDPESGQRGPREVTQLWVHQDTIVDLEIDGHVIATTEDHPFWNHSDAEWQRADTLDSGDLILTADGDRLSVDGIDWGSARTTTAYNLTVDDIHTYFVAAGVDEVLVHNACPDIPGRPFTGKTAPENAYRHLEDVSGLDPHVASDRLHILKKKGNLGPADDGAIGRTGDVYNAETGELLGSLTDPGLGTGR